MPPSENNPNDDKKNRSLLDEIQQMRQEADKGREPELLSSRRGTRRYSVAALLERIVEAFIAEHAGGSAALSEADTEVKRYKLILQTAEYVLAVESIQIDDADKAEIVRRSYTELFTYGPLDALFLDERVTTITIEGAEKIALRYGHGDLVPLDPVFEDENHVRKIIKRLLLDSGAELTETLPIIEAGLNAGGRPVCVNVAGPPVVYEISADIRLHPPALVTLQGLVQSGFCDDKAAQLLTALATSTQGIVIVGETESGKTTLLSALAALLPGVQLQHAWAIERAGELHLPQSMTRRVVQWPMAGSHMAGRQALSFGDQIDAALGANPALMLLDEVRTDEAPAVGRILAMEAAPRQIWTFRGPANSKRLASALGMLARRSLSADEEGNKPDTEPLVRRLYERLPFVVTLRRRGGKLQLYSIAEWQFKDPNSAYADYVELMSMGWDALETTGQRPTHSLDLPDGFWEGSDKHDLGGDPA